MDKKYLATLPFIKTNEQEKKSLSTEIIETKKGNVLAVNVYSLEGTCTHRIFIDEVGWNTLSAKGNWSKQSLGGVASDTERYGIESYYISESDFIVGKSDKKTVTNFFKSINHGASGNHVASIIQGYMDSINSDKACAARSRKRDFEKSVFEKVPFLPNDIDEWVRDTILEHSKYIFMQPRKSNKSYKEGYCTHCEQVVEISSDWKHNETGYCPNCHSEIIYKSAGIKRNGLKDSRNFYIYQAVGRDIFIRFFEAERDYSFDDYKCFSTEFKEYARYYVTDGEMHMWTQDYKRPYCWGWYDRSAEKEASGWVKSKYVYSRISTNPMLKAYSELYNFDLDKTFKDTCLEHMRFEGVKGLANRNYKIDIIDYANAWVRFPFIEYLLKSGLYKISDSVINDSPFNTKRALNTKAKKLHEIFKIPKQDFNLVKQYDYGFQDIQFLLKVREKGYYLDIVDLNYCIKFLEDEKAYKMLEYVTLKELVNYIKKQIGVNPKAYTSPSTVLNDWEDYIKQLIKLEYDLTNNSLIRPKDLNEQHSQMSRLISDIADEGVNAQIKERLPKLQKKLEYSNDNFMIVVPTCAFEIKDEGAKQNHCVGGYVSRHASGTTTILFLRKVADPYNSFYTVEFNNGKVVQCRGYHNIDTPERPQVDLFLEEWLQNKVNKKKKKTAKKPTEKVKSVA